MYSTMKDVEFIGTPFCGINLGWNFTAGHELGIEKIQKAFGIPGKPAHRGGREDFSGRQDFVGVDVRTVTRVPDTLKFFPDLNGYAYLIFSDWFTYAKPDRWTGDTFDKLMDIEPHLKNRGLVTAWSDSGFGIRVKNDINDIFNSRTTALGQIYSAFLNKDVIIFVGGTGNPFANSGLVIAIRSQVPEDLAETMKKADKDYLNLMDVVAELEDMFHLTERLKSAGRRYFSLSPKWAAEIMSPEEKASFTRYSVVFYLDPCDQRYNNYGWFTVEHLLQWIDGKGPIPKK